MLSGLQPGELLIIAARPSMGKTAVAMNIAEQIALGGTPWNPGAGPQVPVAVFSLEMSKASVSLRLLSARSGVNAHELRTGGLDDDTYERVFQAYQELSKAKIFIDDSPSLSVTALRARARRLVRQHDVKVIVIDYLQLLTAPAQGKESRQVEVSAISRGIKALARELNVPIICLSQLNRASEQREGNRPRMSDLRESGSIEQDADVIMLLHREEYYHVQDPSWAEENPDKLGVAELIVAKQRNGPVGVVSLTWDNRTTRFKNHDPHARAPIDYEKYAQSAAPPWDAPAANSNTPAPPPAPNKFGAGGFIAKDKSGPVENFRDGGGPEGQSGLVHSLKDRDA
jgi:replicative DNA helicase